MKAVLFDLGGTLVEGTSPHLNVEKSYFEDQIRAIHDSLRNDGIDVSWVRKRARSLENLSRSARSNLCVTRSDGLAHADPLFDVIA